MHIAIVGNGISGITAARNIRKNSDYNITVISSEFPYFFSRTALMYVYMGHMKFDHLKPYEDFFWKQNRIDLLHDHVKSVNLIDKSLHLGSGNQLAFDKLIIATGSKPNLFNWPGQDLMGVQGLYSYQDLQLLEENTHPALIRASERKVQRAVIVGGGLIGIELAEMLRTRDIEVTMLIREKNFWGSVLPDEDAALVMNHMFKHHIDLQTNTELKEILSDENGRVRAIVTKAGKEITCQFVGLTAGVSPNIDFLRDSGLKIQRGVIVNDFLETNHPDVFAIGDCAEMEKPLPGRKAIEQVWYTGRMMGEAVAQTITGKRTAYDPGPWFNSAKFFDLEYQTYGTVSNKPANVLDHFFWSNKDQSVAIHFVWDKTSGRFIGVNAYGMRLRHELMDRWLRNGKHVNDVIASLNDALFDPEFYKNYTKDIIKSYNERFGLSVAPRKKSWTQIFSFLVLTLFSVNLTAQPAVDGFLKGMGKADVVASFTYDSYSSYFQRLNDPRPVGRSSYTMSVFAAGGITKWLDLQANIPYIYVKTDYVGLQDVSAYLKASLLDIGFNYGNLRVILAGGFSTPMSDYDPYSQFSIGQQATATDGRLVMQFTSNSGLFFMIQGGYISRSDPTPSSTQAAFKMGLAREKYYFDFWYDQQLADGGNDYFDYRIATPSDRDSVNFTTFGVSYGRVGLTYYRPFNEKNAWVAGASYVLWGRNVGQSYTISLGYIRHLNFTKK